MISAFDLFTVGVGPSSSHTVGPMRAAAAFRERLAAAGGVAATEVRAELYGSLAATGDGHRTPQAVVLGLCGLRPEALDQQEADAALASFARTGEVPSPWGGRLLVDIVDHPLRRLPRHVNGMRFLAVSGAGREVDARTYYSVGGGFVVEGDEETPAAEAVVPYPFTSGAELVRLAERDGVPISGIARANERALADRDVEAGLLALWDVMWACVERGLAAEGTLPGPLRVPRRAASLRAALDERAGSGVVDGTEWAGLYAIAVNEENAAGGQVVTAPTNGAAGIIPAVIAYYLRFVAGADRAGVADFLLTATAIGALCKRNASISGAEVGCQGEVGSAAAMAAAGLAEVLGGTPAQVENAAEIALEHSLGLTCDPVAGLVQIPCIERNAIGANKAIAAARLALLGDGTHLVSLDVVIETMRQTGAHMREEYKETARGGLAVNVATC